MSPWESYLQDMRQWVPAAHGAVGAPPIPVAPAGGVVPVALRPQIELLLCQLAQLEGETAAALAAVRQRLAASPAAPPSTQHLA